MACLRASRWVSLSSVSTLLLAAALLLPPPCSLAASAACLRGWTFTAPSMDGDLGLGSFSSRPGPAAQLMVVLGTGGRRGARPVALATVARLRGGGENDEQMGNTEEERQEAAIGDGGADMEEGGEEGLLDFARYGEEANVLAALVAGADPGIYLALPYSG